MVRKSERATGAKTNGLRTSCPSFPSVSISCFVSPTWGVPPMTATVAGTERDRDREKFLWPRWHLARVRSKRIQVWRETSRARLGITCAVAADDFLHLQGCPDVARIRHPVAQDGALEGDDGPLRSHGLRHLEGDVQGRRSHRRPPSRPGSLPSLLGFHQTRLRSGSLRATNPSAHGSGGAVFAVPPFVAVSNQFSSLIENNVLYRKVRET